jgi:formamidopyrimidine-DNA glycosylase
MPELPDIVAYLRALEPRVIGKKLEKIRLSSPFLLRTAVPSARELESKRVERLSRVGKRIVFELEGDLFAVIHLMIAGRLHWRDPGAKLGGKNALAAFDFEGGSLTLTEASTKKRASLHLFRGQGGVRELDRGGIEVLETDVETFGEVLRRENHTLKRSLTDPRLFSGIGNAYSDEILHRAQLSPVKLTGRMTDEETSRLFGATREVLQEWLTRLTLEAETKFPEKVTAFRPEMATHGKYGQPCPVCGTAIARIVYAENEANYCPTCQTGGKLLADRALSRLLKSDWPRTPGELEERMRSVE